MIVVQVAWKAQFLSHLYFRQDDFHDLDLAVEHPFTWSYLTYIGSGHLIIGLRAIAWLLVRTAGTYNWALASAVSMVFVVAADVAALRLLRDLFGERPAILVPFGIYLLTPLTMPDLGVWSSAIESVPLQLAIFMAISAHLRYVQSGSSPHLVGAAFWVAFGLVFFEKALVLPECSSRSPPDIPAVAPCFKDVARRWSGTGEPGSSTSCWWRPTSWCSSQRFGPPPRSLACRYPRRERSASPGN